MRRAVAKRDAFLLFAATADTPLRMRHLRNGRLARARHMTPGRPGAALLPDSRSCAPRSSNDSRRASRRRARARPSACRGAASRAGPGRRASVRGSTAWRRAWLIARFIDEAARFVWLDQPGKRPKTALGFDFDGASFSHRRRKVTFEVVTHSFGLEDDPALRRPASCALHRRRRRPGDEAAGLETMIRGLQAQHADDDALLAAALRCSTRCTPRFQERQHDASIRTHRSWRATARACAVTFRQAFGYWLQARLHQLRRAGRADRDHAPGAGRAAALDLGAALPARAQLLHGAARPRGAAARDLHRLADAPHLGRHRRRRPVRAAVARSS